MAESREVRIGRAIYLAALSVRRGFRSDQIGIDDDAIWQEIFSDLGRNAIETVQRIKR